MKNKLNLSIITLLILCLFTACSNDDDDSKTIEVPEKQQLNQNVYADDTQGKSGVTFTTKGAWTSSIAETTQKSAGNSQSGWVSITPDRGDKADTYTISITLSPNYTGADRSATITIVCGNDKIEIKVTQSAVTDEGKKPEESNVDVYVAGAISGSAKYWKNGQSISLSNGAEAHSIFVSDDDIYVAGFGYEKDGSIPIAKYWKNGQGISLSDSTNYAKAHSVFVSDGDVYVAGYEGRIAKYWKNGQEVTLSDGTRFAVAKSIFVSDNNVYTVGYDGNVAKYWKNGQEVTLNDKGYAHSIFVSNNDVYIAGVVDEGKAVAAYWKNNQQIILGDGTDLSYAYSVFVSGSDIYVAGEDTGSAVYWKNGKKVTLNNDSMEYSSTNSIFVLNNDIYVLGRYNGSALCWKNGKKEIVEGSANSIFVVKK